MSINDDTPVAIEFASEFEDTSDSDSKSLLASLDLFLFTFKINGGF